MSSEVTQSSLVPAMLSAHYCGFFTHRRLCLIITWLTHNLTQPNLWFITFLSWYFQLLSTPQTASFMQEFILSLKSSHWVPTVCTHVSSSLVRERKMSAKQLSRAHLLSVLVQVEFMDKLVNACCTSCPRNTSNRLSHLTPRDSPHLLRSRQPIKLRIGTWPRTINTLAGQQPAV